MKPFAHLVVLTIAAAPACGDGTSGPTDSGADTIDADTIDADDTAVDTTDAAVPPHRCLTYERDRMPLFGDLHVHTRLSLDANLQGTRLGPADAYRFARGEEVGLQPYTADGTALRHLKLERPLDFAAVTDHGEFLGVVNVCTTPGAPGYDAAECVDFRESPDRAFVMLNVYVAAAQDAVTYPGLCGDDGALCREPAEDAWSEIREAAAAANDDSDACAFTSLVGYEWSGAPSTYNLHRNVLFASDVVPPAPITYFDEPWADGLWARLTAECKGSGAGCDVLAIPHNSNLSSGLMFEAHKRDGSPIDRAFAEAQAAMEPLVEVMQHKGDSECLPGTTSADEQCAFEKVPYNSLGAAGLMLETDKNPRDFVRDALLRGLELGQTLGVNPWRFGFIASTDTHLGTPGAVSELTYPGHGGAGAAARDEVPPGLVDQIAFNPGGLAGVWAEENSRAAIFAALRRKETWGTSGPRIVVRFFGGDYDASICDDPNLAAVGYAHGVPMGGTLTRSGDAAGAPTFVVAAQRDPGTEAEPSAPLATIQIVKGSFVGGELKLEVIDVAGGDEGEPGPDLATCAPPGGGHDRLCGVWRDPTFDAAVPAFWYARVLERPTCRWSTRQCLAAGIDPTPGSRAAAPRPSTPGSASCAGEIPAGFEACCAGKVEPTIRERAWTSPIYGPGSTAR